MTLNKIDLSAGGYTHLSINYENYCPSGKDIDVVATSSLKSGKVSKITVSYSRHLDYFS